MKNVIDFLNDLVANNNKEWFDKNRARYKEVQSSFNSFTESLIKGIASFDPAISNLGVKDCTYRIYRDIRFSKDKTPYKNHMGAFIAPKGKCGGFAGYYFHIEGNGADYIGSHLLSSGVYRPLPVVIKSIREEIMLNGGEFVKAIDSAKGFSIERIDMLKRVPAGFPSDSEYADLFRLKDYFLSREISEDFLTDKNLLENCVAEFKKTYEFNRILNKAIEYAYEEEGN